MSFFGSLKKLSLKKVVATVKKTASDATKIVTSTATGGIAGGLAAVGSLKKDSSLTPTTVYGSPEAANAVAAAAAPVPTGDGGNSTLIFAGLAILALLLLSRR